MYILYALIVLRFGRVWSSPSSAFQFESSDTTVVRKAQDIIRLLLVLTAIDRSKKLESHSEAEPEKKEKGKTKEMEDDQSNHGNGKGNLDTAKADRSVWLMKCPLVVAKSWQNQASSQDSQPVAKVILSLDPLQSDSMQFTMETTAVSNDSLNRPKSYSLNMFKDFVPMSVFSESNQGKVAMEGKVEHKFDMKPHEKNMEEYGRLCRERTNKSMIKNRQIQVIDNDHGVHMRPMPGMVGLISSNSKKKAQPVKQTEVKRTRRDRGELEDIMFKLFERQPNWALKQLVQETDQPAQFLKEILNELCVYNKRGTNQGTYELKPEYKKSVEDGGAD